jgi:hypothetical protein
MNCEILHSLYIRANGQIACDDDYGQERVIGAVTHDDNWSILDVFSNEYYLHISEALASQRMPWPQLCKHCALLQAAPFSNGIALRRLKKIQIEPSLRCTLLCPNCSRIGWLKSIRPTLLDITLYKKTLFSLSMNDFKIDNIEFCGQGEPLSHPDFFEFVRIGRELHPYSSQRLFTNGNYDYLKTIQKAKVDTIFVACDGLYQSNYERYRIRGSVSKALKFMSDAKKFSPSTEIVWKYILFEHNDSDEELVAAQNVAEQMGVDRLLFILTPTNNRSKRFDIDSVVNFPLVWNKSVIESHPMLTHIECEGHPLSDHFTLSYSNDKTTRYNNCVIDSVYITARPERKLLVISGWAVQIDGAPLQDILISINNQEALPCLRVNIPRPDVTKHYPALSNSGIGFSTVLTLHENFCEEEIMVSIKMVSQFDSVEVFSVRYALLRV